MKIEDLKIIIENPKGSFKSFRSDDHPEFEAYPLVGVTFPVDYGYIEGYTGEDGHDLDVFRGSGMLCGYIKVWRIEIPEETKFILHVSQEEFDQILNVYEPVLLSSKVMDEEQFSISIQAFKPAIKNS